MPPREYEVVVSGELGDDSASVFTGMTLERRDGNTILTGRMRDQRELQRLLTRISDLGLTLLSAQSVEE